VDKLALNQGEKMMVWRRRQHLSIKQMAEKHGFTRNRYASLERMSEVPELVTPIIEDLSLPEKCLILRRRRGWTQKECAEMMSITRYWYNQMEMGKEPSSSLVKFWEN